MDGANIETTETDSVSTAEISTPRAAAWDEMVTGAGELRPAWRDLFAALSMIGNLKDRAQRIAESIELDGALGIGPGAGSASVWRLDPVPMVFSAEEWASLETGLIQRARLLDAVLCDLYGRRRLLEERVVPAAAILGSPSFVRAAMVSPERAARLTMLSVDLVRGPDGGWLVHADHADVPLGVGHALANRRLMARAMTEAYQSVGPRPLAPFFDLWQTALIELAPAGISNPHTVLLAPGPLAAARAESVFLTRELGLSLVEQADLTVRGGGLHLKTLGGLKPVDVVLRAVPSDGSDPLDMPGRETGGVPGLLSAVRAGRVAIANPIGAGVLEIPTLVPFIGEAASHLLEEDPILAPVETLWAGLDLHRRRILDDPNGFEFIDVRLGGTRAGSPGRTADDLATLLEDMERRPRDWVARCRPTPSTAPGWGGEGLVPKPLYLRCFLVGLAGDWTVMPGGLAWTPPDIEAPRVSHDRQPVEARDVWILPSERRERLIPPSPVPRSVSTMRTAGELQSRVADDLFWFGRYVERLDGAARILRSAISRIATGGISPREALELKLLGGLMVIDGILDPSEGSSPVDGNLFSRAIIEAGAAGRPLQGLFREIDRLATGFRDRASRDMWRSLTALAADARRALDRAAGNADRSLRALDQTIHAVAAVNGVTTENMTRGTGWHFLHMGRRLERGIFSSRTLSTALGGDRARVETALKIVLELFDSTITYRTRYNAAILLPQVLDLTLSDDTNPRSVAYQITAMARHLDTVPVTWQPGPDSVRARLTEALAALQETIATRRVVELAENGETDRLARILDDVKLGLLRVSDDLTRAFFVHLPPQHAIGIEAWTR